MTWSWASFAGGVLAGIGLTVGAIIVLFVWTADRWTRRRIGDESGLCE